MRLSLLLTFALLTTQALAQAPLQTQPQPTAFTTILPLWPAGQVPLAQGTAEADTPRLYAYPAPGPGPHPAVVVAPGGGYTQLVMVKEGEVPARWLNAHGVSAYILAYRISPAYHYPAPMLDAARAVRYLRAHGSALALDPAKVGIWGFSAGGHLAGYLATQHPALATPADAVDAQSSRPDFAILSYARLSTDPTIPHSSLMETLLGANPTAAALAAVDATTHVTADTSPSFLYATGMDEKVDPLNASQYFSALHRAHIPVELHIFQTGPHGTGLANLPVTPAELAIWPTLLANWLQLNHILP